MAEVKAYHLTGEKSRELNEAIAVNAQTNTDMEMTLIPRMTAQSYVAKLTGVAIFFSCLFFVQGTMDTLTAVVMVISAFIVYASPGNSRQLFGIAGERDACHQLEIFEAADESVQKVHNPKHDDAGGIYRPSVS